MAEDLGFHKDPKDWIIHDMSIITQEDIEIRRRIYWGCYNSDKLISLVLGRSVQLSCRDASVETTDILPYVSFPCSQILLTTKLCRNFPQMQPWLPEGCSNDLNPAHGSHSLLACFQEQIRLSNIIERILTGRVSLQAATASRWEGCTSDLNLQLHRWKDSLPVSLRWNEWESSSNSLNPSIAIIQ